MSFPGYPEYKRSGIDWLQEVPKTWEIKPLKYLLTLNPRKSEFDGDKQQVCSFVPMEKLKTGEVILDEQRPIEEVIGGYTFFQDGDVLQAKVTPCFENKNVALAEGLVNGVGFGSSEINVLRPINQIDSEYLFYRVQEDAYMDVCTSSMIGAGGLRRVPSDVINNFTVAVPPFQEQLQIARFLNHETAKIDALIREQERLIELLQEKRQAVISHAVTKGLDSDVPMKDSGVEWLGEVPAHWQVGALKRALEVVADVDHYMPSSVSDGVPYVMTGDLRGLASEIEFDSCKQVARADFLRLARKIRTSKGDVIMARYATIGTVSYVDIDAEFVVSYSCVTIRPQAEKATGRYLFFYFQSDAFIQGMSKMVNANTQGNVGVGDLREVKIALPDIHEQEAIVEEIEFELAYLDGLVSEVKKTIVLMRERRSALISAAVTGKIDVRDWQPPSEEKYTSCEESEF